MTKSIHGSPFLSYMDMLLRLAALRGAGAPLLIFFTRPHAIAEVTGSTPVEALIFSGFSFPVALIGKSTAMIILPFDLQTQFKYMNYFIYTSHDFKSFHLCYCD